MVGWYHSGPKLRASDLMINELFKQYNPNPILVIVDVKPTTISLPTDAYFSVEQVHNVYFIFTRMEQQLLELLNMYLV